jgi:hypothetical protein
LHIYKEHFGIHYEESTCWWKKCYKKMT